MNRVAYSRASAIEQQRELSRFIERPFITRQLLIVLRFVAVCAFTHQLRSRTKNEMVRLT